MPGVHEACEFLDSIGIPRGLITCPPARPPARPPAPPPPLFPDTAGTSTALGS